MAWPKGRPRGEKQRAVILGLWADPTFALNCSRLASERMRELNRDPQFVAKKRAGTERWQRAHREALAVPTCCYCGVARSTRVRLEPDGPGLHSCRSVADCETRIVASWGVAS